MIKNYNKIECIARLRDQFPQLSLTEAKDMVETVALHMETTGELEAFLAKNGADAAIVGTPEAISTFIKKLSTTVGLQVTEDLIEVIADELVTHRLFYEKIRPFVGHIDRANDLKMLIVKHMALAHMEKPMPFADMGQHTPQHCTVCPVREECPIRR